MTHAAAARPLKVLQITDPHLMANAEGALLGVVTLDSLDAVIQEALARHGQPDLVLATGDLAQDGSAAAYQVFGERLSAFRSPSAWIAGNHDHADRLADAAERFGARHRAILEGGWQIVLLDSSVPGKVHGELSDAELTFLDATLAAHPERPALVTLHHHPVDIGCDWMSGIGLNNADALWAVLDRHPQVRIVLWGHIHQEYTARRNGVTLLASPSTCIQFATGSSQFSVEPLAPGYRWFELAADGRFHTDVGRATAFQFDLDETSAGY